MHGGLGRLLLGSLYLGFAVLSFDPRAAPTESALDGPVARIGRLFQGYQRVMDQIKPETPTEALLLEALDRNMNFSGGVMLLMLRVFLGTLVVVGGLIALTVFVERERLLRVIRGP